MQFPWLSFDRRESGLSRPLPLIMRGFSAEEKMMEVDADDDSEWMISCQNLRANWLLAKKTASSA